MYLTIQKCFGLILSLTLLCIAVTQAMAQYATPSDTYDRSYDVASGPASFTPVMPASAADNYLVSNAAADDDFAKRLADVEKALKKIDDKAAADKKAAASKPSFAVGGLIQYDTAAFGGKNAATLGSPSLVDPAGRDAFINGTTARRLRLQVTGEAFLNTEYKLEVDFASTSRPTFKDVYFVIKELPYVQNVRIGHFKEPFGLEQQTSDRRTTFMERSMADEGFIVPARNIGVMLHGWTENERATFAIGGFLNQPGVENPPIFGYNVIPGAAYPNLPTAAPGQAAFTLDDEPQTALTMRATWLPWYDEATEGRGLWHLGAAYSYRSDEGYRVGANPVIASNYQVRPEAFLAPVILNTSALPAIDNQLMGVEIALVYGPFSFQSEYFGDFIQQPGGNNVTFTGGYAYVSYFLTGENRPYNRKTACFDPIKPFTNFFRVRTEDGSIETGWGAWEIGYRVTYVDMLDGITGAARTVGLGRATDQTIGLNWYLNPNSRIMANYIFTTFDRVDVANTAPVDNHTVNTFEMRAQFEF
ncbi:MAG TPA: porin [Thermoguttaceae bacterium]